MVEGMAFKPNRGVEASVTESRNNRYVWVKALLHFCS